MAEIKGSETIAAPGLRALLSGIIDYAGTFPPASLALDEAVENYARHRTSGESWMLGKFVLPASNLADLENYADLIEQNPPFRFSVLAGRGDDADTFVDALNSDLECVAAFRSRLGNLVRIDAFEMHMPGSVLTTDVVTARRFVSTVDSVLERHDQQRADLFFEIPLDQNLRQTAPIVAGALHAFNRDRTIEEHGQAGLKMRTGGTESTAFPPTESVAFVIAASRDAGIPFKATAGLHHPVRHFSRSVNAKMHGFLNVFVAAVMATAEKSGEDDIVSILLEESADAFSFDENGIKWRGHQASIDVVKRTRRDRAVSFGSCSFAEPVDDLRTLGLL